MKNIEKLAVDANPIISTLLGGQAYRIFWNPEVKRFLTTEFTFEEVRFYIPRLARKLEVEEEILLLDLQLLPLEVFKRSSYQNEFARAESILLKRDLKDADLLALALQFGIPIWSNDKDFQETGARIYTTAQLLKLLEP